MKNKFQTIFNIILLSLLSLGAVVGGAGVANLWHHPGDATIDGILRATFLHSEMTVTGNGTATTINTVNVWEKVAILTEGDSEGWTFSSSSVSADVGSSGHYSVTGSVSASAAGTNKDFQMAISINDSIQTNCTYSRKYANSDTGNRSIVCEITVADADVIKLETRNITDDTDITIIDAGIVLHQN